MGTTVAWGEAFMTVLLGIGGTCEVAAILAPQDGQKGLFGLTSFPQLGQ